MSSNPFRQEYVLMYFPEGMARVVSVEGHTLQAEKDGSVEVPNRLVSVLKSHGLTDVPPAPVSKK